MSKIIAEIGVNWSGKIEIAKEMIFQSKRAGADFVKFQMFGYEEIKNSKYEVELSEMILHFEQLNLLRGYAFQQNIGFGVSTMYPESFDSIRKIGVPLDFVKIRCKDNQNEKIARPAVKYCVDYDIPLLISTERPISDEDYYRYNLYPTQHAKYLYCIPKYPPEITDIIGSYISPEKFDGYSNHSPYKFFPMIAVSRELEFVEIHVKREENLNSLSYTYTGLQIDANVSIGFDDLEEVCNLNKILSQLK